MIGNQFIGVKNGLCVYASDSAIAQNGLNNIKQQLGMANRYPVKTDLSGNIVMVEANSHEEAIQRYLNRGQS